MLFALLIGGASAAPAYAQSPVWAISSSSSPTNFAPGDETGDDKYVLTVVDAGGRSDAGSPIEVSDTLPTGITASAVSGEDLGNGHALVCNLTPKPTCTYEGFEMAPGDILRIEVTVKVNSGVAASVTNSVSVGGGGAATGAQAEDPTTISPNQAAFGISDFAATWSDTQAGAAVNLTAGFTFNQIVSGGKTYPAADDKQAVLSLPPGFIANPLAVPYCTIGEVSAGSCPLDTAVGVAFTSRSSGGGASVQYSSLVYNTAPELGQLGALTVFLPGVPLRLGMTLQTDGRLQLTAEDIPAVGLISTTLTLWGIPAAYDGAGPDHVQASGEPDFGDSGAGPPAARFLTSAVSCGAAPDTTLSAESWEAPGIRLEAPSETPTLTGCNRLPFSPSLDVNPEVNYANAPSGYGIDVHLPQPRRTGAGLGRDGERNDRAAPGRRHLAIGRGRVAGVRRSGSWAGLLYARDMPCCFDDRYGRNRDADPRQAAKRPYLSGKARREPFSCATWAVCRGRRTAGGRLDEACRGAGKQSDRRSLGNLL